jgi:ABC-type polysaccharide/polyol phosphate export permease
MRTKKFYSIGTGQFSAQKAALDIVHGILAYKIWGLLGWQDICQRYRRSVIGPFWLTISTGILIGAMSLLYSRLFNMPMEIYAPFLASGIVIWALLRDLLNDSCAVFMEAESMIKQVRETLTLHVCRMVWRNTIIFFHNVVILVIVFMIFVREFQPEIFLLPIALLIIAINGIWAGLVLGVCCARFRDIAPIVASFVQVSFFLTPIMWHPDILKGSSGAFWLVEVNPFFHLLDIVRAPFLGKTASLESWVVAIVVTLLGMIAAFLVLKLYRHRVVYWL